VSFRRRAGSLGAGDDSTSNNGEATVRRRPPSLLLALLMVSWLGRRTNYCSVFSSFQSLEVTAGKRASMRRDTWQIFLHNPVAGTGLGTLQLVYPQYESLYDGKIVNHTHKRLPGGRLLRRVFSVDFLVPGFSASYSANPLSGCVNSMIPLQEPCKLSGLVACAGFLVHGLVDFNLHIPSNAFLFFPYGSPGHFPDPGPSLRRPPPTGRAVENPLNH